MTKKQFKELCSFQQYGSGKNKRNAIYYDWKDNDKGRGYKFLVKASVQDCLKADLFNTLHNWVTKEMQPPWYVTYNLAYTDAERFRVAIMG